MLPQFHLDHLESSDQSQHFPRILLLAALSNQPSHPRVDNPLQI